MVVGVIGLSGSGKNVVSHILERSDFYHIDTDLLGHKALALCAGKLSLAFGPEVLNQDGTVNRRALGSKVFTDQQKLKELESIVFPVITDLCSSLITEKGDCTVNGVKLLEAGLESKCDLIIEVRSNAVVRFCRVWRRDRIAPAHIFKRFYAQRKQKTQQISCNVDKYIVANRFSVKRLEKKIFKILRKYGR